MKVNMKAGLKGGCVLAVMLCLCGCGAKDKDHDSHDGHDHSSHADHGEQEEWCNEHDVAEAACTRCNPSLIAEFQAKGDWCAGHDVPESQCVKCNPGLANQGGHGATQGDIDRIGNRKCEHGYPILDCDECRYEVGVVKLDPRLAKNLISTAKAESRAAVTTLRLTGQVELDPTRAAEIVPMSGGVVTSVKAFLGDDVRRGDVLAVIRSSELGEAKAAFLEADAYLKQSKKRLERESALQREGISSEAEYLDAEKEYTGIAAKRAAAEKKLFAYGLSKAQVIGLGETGDTSGFADLVLKAPRDGKLISQNITEGGYVEGSAHVYTVADLSALWVWCDLYERDLGVLHTGLSAEKTVSAVLTVRAFPGEEFRGVVDLIGSTVDKSSRTVKVRARVPNPDGKLRPGMFAVVEIALKSDKMALSVPTSAVLQDNGKSFVFQQWKNNMWARRDVEIAGVSDDMTLISSGLPTGATVVVDGAFMFKSDVLRAKMGAG